MTPIEIRTFYEAYNKSSWNKLTDEERKIYSIAVANYEDLMMKRLESNIYKIVNQFYFRDLEKANCYLRNQLDNEIAFNEKSEVVKKWQQKLIKMQCCGNCQNIFVCKKADKNGLPKPCDEWEFATNDR